MTKLHLTIGLLASLSTALIFSLPEQACKLSGGRKAAEAAAVIATLVKTSPIKAIHCTARPSISYQRTRSSRA